MSIVKTNKFQTLAGDTMNVPIQVVRTSVGNQATTSAKSNENAAYAISTTTTTWTDYSFLQLTITPKFANSIIKLELCCYLNQDATTGYGGVGIRIRRGTTIVWEPQSNTTGPYGSLYSGQVYFTPTFIVFDSPAVTTPITYILQYRTYNGTSSTLFAYPGSTQFGSINTFVATEIAQ